MDMATETESLPAPIGSAAEGIAARIAAERERLAAEEANERELIDRCKAIIADADDATLDELELKIGSSRSRQLRLIARVDALIPQLIAANEAAQAVELDALRARADQARILGESLIREFAKLAKPLIPLLRKSYAIEAFIEESNQRLVAAGREAIASPNAIRCRQGQTFNRTSKRVVGIGEPLHPHHADVSPAYLGFGGDLVRLNDGSTCERFMEIDVVEPELVHADYPDPLHLATYLPGIRPAADDEQHAAPLWDASHATVDEAALRSIEAELDADPAVNAGKATRARSSGGEGA
jgi:hypothetical protein